MVVLNPGRTFGALEFRRALTAAGCAADVVVAEAATNLMTARSTGPAQSHIARVKHAVPVAALRPERTAEVVAALGEWYPQFTAGRQHAGDLVLQRRGGHPPGDHPAQRRPHRERPGSLRVLHGRHQPPGGRGAGGGGPGAQGGGRAAGGGGAEPGGVAGQRLPGHGERPLRGGAGQRGLSGHHRPVHSGAPLHPGGRADEPGAHRLGGPGLRAQVPGHRGPDPAWPA